MKYGWKILIAFFLCQSVEAKVLSVCDLNSEIYQKEIFPKIESGIPFELMLVVTLSDRIIDRRMSHFSHNLWDEIVTLKSNNQVITKFPLKDAASQICKNLRLEVNEPISKGNKYKVRLLLNPMWSERMARLHLSTRADLENKKLIGIDWKKIAEEMPSEKILMEKEMDL